MLYNKSRFPNLIRTPVPDSVAACLVNKVPKSVHSASHTVSLLLYSLKLLVHVRCISIFEQQ